MIYENEIALGDAYELIRSLPDKSVDCILTDPPYLIESIKGGRNRLGESIMSVSAELDENGIRDGIGKGMLDEFMRVMKAPNIYIWCNLKQIKQYLDYFVGEKKLNWNLIVWHKTNAMPLCGSKYMNDCEYCLFFRRGVRLNTEYETAHTVYNLPINQADKDDFGHPTIKPEPIIANMLSNSVPEGGIVLDPFCGSGTVPAAAKKLGMRYIGFEINPKWHKVAQDRLEGITLKDRRLGHEQLTLF